MKSIDGFSYRHVDLEFFLQGLYREDWINLSKIGLDIFNLGLQSMVEKAAAFFWGGYARINLP